MDNDTHKCSGQFSDGERARLLSEIETEGFHEDSILIHQHDSPVCGVNVACAYPLPEPFKSRYSTFAAKINAHCPFAYAYPIQSTHITIATLIDFTQTFDATAARLQSVQDLRVALLKVLRPQFKSLRHKFGQIVLVSERPLISRNAVIIPFQDPLNSLNWLRRCILSAIKSDAKLYQKALDNGFEIPNITHATVIRFIAKSQNINNDLKTLTDICKEIDIFKIVIDTILFTHELTPYMQNGTIMESFEL